MHATLHIHSTVSQTKVRVEFWFDINIGYLVDSLGLVDIQLSPKYVAFIEKCPDKVDNIHIKVHYICVVFKQRIRRALKTRTFGRQKTHTLLVNDKGPIVFYIVT